MNSFWMDLVRPIRWDAGPGSGRHASLLPGDQQPPELGGHSRAAVPAQPAHAVPQVLPQAGADLGAGDRPVLVGAGVSLHEAIQQGIPGQAPGKARRGPGHHAPGLRALSDQPGVGVQFPGRDPLHRRQARRAGLALSTSAQAEGRRHRFRHRRHGRAAIRADQHHHPLPGRSPELLGPVGRQHPSGRGTGRGAADPCRVPAPELRSGRDLPPGLPAVGQPAVDRRTHNWPSCIRTTRRGADRSERAPGHAGRKRPGLLGCHRR